MAGKKGGSNVYWQDDRYFVKKISDCTCVRKEDELYLLTCRIRERGEKDYYCSDDPEYIQRDSKRLWLTDEARSQIKYAVDEFNEKSEALYDKSCKRIDIDACRTVIHYRRSDKTGLDFLLEIGHPNIASECSEMKLQFMDSSIEELLHELSWHIPGDDRIVDMIRHSTVENINDNPIYKAAIDTDDLEMQRLIKLYYRIANEDECRWISDNVFGTYILPPLSEEYNKSFFVCSDGIDSNLLAKSGYRILHKPYFAMPGNTHGAWTLNPYSKVGTDAAPVQEEKISFEEYLGLFGSKEGWRKHEKI